MKTLFVGKAVTLLSLVTLVSLLKVHLVAQAAHNLAAHNLAAHYQVALNLAAHYQVAHYLQVNLVLLV